ncbi:protein kinase domain-containing protein [Fischerella thermalis]|uniref:protein kinase domain-containing protein n=1 Tax=Fischerella thermalis TaxID=372787 RepID=UPI000C7F84EC|nr:hypothetical protein [Fischerella thermalis]PLZ06463.1 hypothetical protein CBP17_19210 [Fischerella thermalis WC114]PLZ06900.1 hypothetical protein CBP18_18340 [Fischerella thermalis WC119]PLZ15991.1 hypothetical protein CBP19_05825 [Fischerella thermalis WC1110]PLZ16689.1 hypothetical protein CBP29_23005 [Fischerella thermalis WC341]PLZ22255.1 hypothetical protein CBP30_06745 [Fischerella thermalis WC157]PLZ31580.1 hypothetical protein CBP10_11495 [Fischerella thermalis WC558]PLZ43237.1
MDQAKHPFCRRISRHRYSNYPIHKDIKPANILINPTTKQIKIIDFSIASLRKTMYRICSISSTSTSRNIPTLI